MSKLRGKKKSTERLKARIESYERQARSSKNPGELRRPGSRNPKKG